MNDFYEKMKQNVKKLRKVGKMINNQWKIIKNEEKRQLNN